MLVGEHRIVADWSSTRRIAVVVSRDRGKQILSGREIFLAFRIHTRVASLMAGVTCGQSQNANGSTGPQSGPADTIDRRYSSRPSVDQWLANATMGCHGFYSHPSVRPMTPSVGVATVPVVLNASCEVGLSRV